MKKNLTLFFVLIASLFLIFSCSFISANAILNISSALASIKSVASTLPDELVTQIFIFIIVSLSVYSVLSTLGLFNNMEGISFALSLAIGGLSSYFMGSDYLNLIKLFYESFGGVLIALIPFSLLGLFTYVAVIRRNVQLLLMLSISWFIFFLFLIYTIISNIGMFKKSVLIFFIIISGLVLTLAIFNDSFIRFLERILFNAQANAIAKNMDEFEKGVATLRGVGRNMGGYK